MKIAIIEDERKLAETLKDGLEAEGYEVATFSDAESAGEAFEETQFDLAILDLMLPGKSGFEFCRDLRRGAETLPILVLTARSTEADTIEALNSGADDYVTKPFSFNELLARLRALLRRPRSIHTEIIAIHDLTFDANRHEVIRGGAVIPLTKTEYDLLYLLLTNPGRVFTRDDISRDLLGSSDSNSSNVVEVHVSNLRRKIDGEYEKKIIRTIRNAGYALAA